MADKNIDALNDKISEYLTDIITLKGKVSTLEEEKAKLAKDLNSERSVTRKLKTKVNELEKEIESLRAEIEVLNKKENEKKE